MLYSDVEEEDTKMAKRMEKLYKGSHNKTALPKRTDRVKLNTRVNLNFTATLTGHGNTTTHLHRFKVL
jgi:hypothetical protein